MTALPVTEWDGLPVSVLRERWRVPLVEAYGTIGSTNDRAAELAAEGAAPYSVVVADVQTAGRGRRGRSWISEPGDGLLMSIVLPPASPDRLGALPLLVGLAVAEGVERLTRAVSVTIKWPNDLWVRGRKVAGVLCEAHGGRVVAGLGVNVRGSPRGTDGSAGRATSLEAEGAKSLTLHALAQVIVERVEETCGPGDGVIEADALLELRRRDALADLEIVSDVAGPGRGAGLDDDGALLLLRPDGSTVRVVAGGIRLR